MEEQREAMALIASIKPSLPIASHRYLMSVETNPTEGGPSEIHFVIGNINGPSHYKGRKVRRNLIIANILKGANYQPDFLAFQDGVLPIDVREFTEALNETTSGLTEYSDVQETAKRQSEVASRTKQNCYKTNHEALLYSKVWERLYEEENSFYDPCTGKVKSLLRDRCRFGIFKKEGSAVKMMVVCYHGRTKQIKRFKSLEDEELTDDEKQGRQTRKNALTSTSISQVVIDIRSP
jgi:hypothetical protein